MRVLAVIFAAALIAALGGLSNLTADPEKPAALTPKQQLGKSIFFDTELSFNRNQSCAQCHEPDAGFSGTEFRYQCRRRGV